MKKFKDYYLNLYEEITFLEKKIYAYENFHNWKYFQYNHDKNENYLLSVFKNTPIEDWENIFKAWYCR
jgi:hypothetical protein